MNECRNDFWPGNTLILIRGEGGEGGMKRLSSLTKDKTNEFTAAGADLGASWIMRALKCLDVMLDPITSLLKGRNKGKGLNGEGFIAQGCMHVFIYFSPLRPHSAAFGDAAIHPAAQLICTATIYSEEKPADRCSVPTAQLPCIQSLWPRSGSRGLQAAPLGAPG